MIIIENLKLKFDINNKEEVFLIKKKIRAALIKAQAAMEFLMTYGWAVLVILVAIAALVYFGVLSPDRFVPTKCFLPAGIACIDYNVETSRIILENQPNVDYVVGAEYGELPLEMLVRYVRGEDISLEKIPALTYKKSGQVQGFDSNFDSLFTRPSKTPLFRSWFTNGY